MVQITRRNIECNTCENDNCFIKKCEPEWLSKLNLAKNTVLYKKGQNIFKDGENVFGIYFIKKGMIKVISDGLNGREQIVRLATGGHILGHRGYGKERYHIGAIALCNCEICFFDNNILYEAFKVNFEFTYALMMFYSEELRKSEQRTKYFAQMLIVEKVTYSLCYVIETFGYNSNNKAINITLQRNELAAIAGTNAEQVSRTLAWLKKNGCIDTQGKEILLKNYESMKKIIAPYANGIF